MAKDTVRDITRQEYKKQWSRANEVTISTKIKPHEIGIVKGTAEALGISVSDMIKMCLNDHPKVRLNLNLNQRTGGLH